MAALATEHQHHVDGDAALQAALDQEIAERIADVDQEEAARVTAEAAMSDELSALRDALWCLQNCDADRIRDCQARVCGGIDDCTVGAVLRAGSACLAGGRWGACSADGNCIVHSADGMVLVPGATFWQGCNAALDGACLGNESPYHEVEVPAFWIDETEVTNVEMASFLTVHGNDCDGVECVDADNADLKLSESGGVWTALPGYETHPVGELTWYGAVSYCTWTGGSLCTESQWELAARGTDGRVYPWGNGAPGPELANCSESVCGDGFTGTAPVGSFPLGASPYGALDLAGNVFEWVEDDWHSSYDGAPVDGSAWVDAPRGAGRVLRGGSWDNFAANLRSSYRYADAPSFSFDFFGARCCRSTR